MAPKGSKKLPLGSGATAPIPGLNQELADAFSDAVFGLLDHNCNCPSARFVRLLVKYRKDMFKGGEAIGQDYDLKTD